MERNRIQALQRLEQRRLSEEALHRLHSIMHGDNDPAMLHVVHHLEDKDLLTALCVSRRWRGNGPRARATGRTRCSAARVHGHSICLNQLQAGFTLRAPHCGV